MINFKPGSAININSLPPIKETEFDLHFKSVAKHNPILWLDADEQEHVLDGNGDPITADGTQVAKWKTKRGFGGSFGNQNTVTSRPTLKKDQINGRSAMFFDHDGGSEQFRMDMIGTLGSENMGRMYQVEPYNSSTSANRALLPMAIAFVFKADEADRQECIFQAADIGPHPAYNHHAWFFAKYNSKYEVLGYNQNGGGRSVVGGTADTNWHYAIFVFSTNGGNGGGPALYIDGSEITFSQEDGTGDPYVNVVAGQELNGFSLGGHHLQGGAYVRNNIYGYSGGNNYLNFKGSIAEFIMFKYEPGVAWTDSDIYAGKSDIESYFAYKYNL